MRNITQWHVRAFTMILVAVLVLTLGLPAWAQGEEAEYTVLFWVEMPDFQGDPRDPVTDPEAKTEYILFNQEYRRAPVGETISLTAETAGECLRAPGNGRRFASFLSSDEAEVAADGTTQVNVYYVRDVFEYEFDLVNEQSEMEIGGLTYTGTGDRYTIYAKFEQSAIIPGLNNGFLPVNTNPSLPNAYCAGWALDERLGATELLTHSDRITEAMLPSDEMWVDGEPTVFTFKGLWYDGAEQSILATWFEQLPEHEALTDVNRMTYNGKVYVNFPATNFPFTLPKGGKPNASSAPGLIFVTRIDADESLPGEQGRTWSFLYDRERFSVSFDTNGADPIPTSRDIMYQQNLYQLDPGWNENTTRTSGGTTYRFAGWYTSDGEFVANSLSAIYMPAKNLALSAKWEAIG